MSDDNSFNCFAGADWLMARFPDERLSPLAVEVADLLGVVYAGIYHLPPSNWKTFERWSDHRNVWVVVPAGLATWDFNTLTKLVVLTHDRLLRMEIDPAGPKALKLSFWSRTKRIAGTVGSRLPYLEHHIQGIRRTGLRIAGADALDYFRSRPRSEWCEERFGPCLWWKFPIEEPPYVGTPLDSDWPGDPWTHWTPIIEPELPCHSAATGRGE